MAETGIFNGKDSFRKRMELYDKALEIEPNNPIILHARGLTKFHARVDLKGAFEDMEKSIVLSTDLNLLEMRYLNRGLCYFEIEDMSNACEDWKKAGTSGEGYIKKYCNYDWNEPFGKNLDNQIELEIRLVDKNDNSIKNQKSKPFNTYFLRITLKNKNHETIEIQGSEILCGHKNGEYSYFLEVKLKDQRIISYFQRDYKVYGLGKVKRISRNESLTQKIQISDYHNFLNSGVYLVRIGLRPSKQVRGLTKTYYSNWVKVRVDKNSNLFYFQTTVFLFNKKFKTKNSNSLICHSPST